MVELDIATGPGEFDGIELRAERFVEIDRHVRPSRDVQRRQIPERHRRTDRSAGTRVGMAHHRCADVARGIKPSIIEPSSRSARACTSVWMPPLVPRSPGTILAA